MRLQVLLPTEVLVDEPVRKVVAEADDGFFCLLPRHLDMATSLVAGILTFTDDDGEERLLAVDRGVLVKCGADVLVSTPNAVAGHDLATLQQTIATHFRDLDEDQRVARSALARLEAGTLRRFLELEEYARGR